MEASRSFNKSRPRFRFIFKNYYHLERGDWKKRAFNFSDNANFLERYSSHSDAARGEVWEKTGEVFLIIEQSDDHFKVDLPKPRISSKYWYTDEGVFRLSAHWGQVKKCYWAIEDFRYNGLAFCKWEDFQENDHPLQPIKKWKALQRRRIYS